LDCFCGLSIYRWYDWLIHCCPRRLG